MNRVLDSLILFFKSHPAVCFITDSHADDADDEPRVLPVEMFAELRELFLRSLYYGDFSRALYSRTMETGKTIERQAHGSLSLLNNFCVLKFNRASHRAAMEMPLSFTSRRRPWRHNFRLEAGIRSNAEFASSSSIVQTTGEQLLCCDLPFTAS